MSLQYTRLKMKTVDEIMELADSWMVARLQPDKTRSDIDIARNRFRAAIEELHTSATVASKLVKCLEMISEVEMPSTNDGEHDTLCDVIYAASSALEELK